MSHDARKSGMGRQDACAPAGTQASSLPMGLRASNASSSHAPAIPHGYRQTEVGVIPVEWEVVPLRRLLKSPPSYGINAPAIAYDSRCPTYLRITDISEEGRFISDSKASVSHPLAMTYLLNEGDVVFARTGASVGKSYLYDPRDELLVYAGFLIRIQPDSEKLVSAYLTNFVHSRPYWNWVKVNSMRSGQPGINGQEYASLLIPLPPTKAEQRAIASALSDADALIEGLERLIAKKRDLKQGAMQELLTGKRRLPGFTGKWETKRLGEIFSISAGKSKSAYMVNGGCYWIVDMGSVSTNGRLIVSKGTNYHGDFLKRGDLVMPKDDIGGGNIIGKVGYIDADDTYVLGDHVYCLRANSGDSLFLSYIINGHQTNIALRKKVIGSAQLGLGRKSVETQEIPFPQPSEQTAIASVLSDLDAELAGLEGKLAKARQVKQGMMQELLTGRVRLV